MTILPTSMPLGYPRLLGKKREAQYARFDLIRRIVPLKIRSSKKIVADDVFGKQTHQRKNVSPTAFPESSHYVFASKICNRYNNGFMQ